MRFRIAPTDPSFQLSLLPALADDGPHEAVQQLLVGRVLHLRLLPLPLLGGAAAAHLDDDRGRTPQPVGLPDGDGLHPHLRLRGWRRWRHGRDEGILTGVGVIGISAAVQHELGEQQPVVAVRDQRRRGGRGRKDELLGGLAEQELLRQHAEGGTGGLHLLCLDGLRQQRPQQWTGSLGRQQQQRRRQGRRRLARRSAAGQQLQ